MESQDISSHFIAEAIKADLGKSGLSLKTRFPPEPNGYIHIGHAKSICLNFGLAQEFNGGTCNLRFDDTNPVKEDQEYVDSIKEDVKWLGFDWDDREFYASDYYEKLFDWAVQLIRQGDAYVCDLTQEQTKDFRGTVKIPGTNSPYRDRSPEENLALFMGMKNGEYEEGSRILRAKIDMTSPNMHMRDPAIYRILKRTHHRTGDDWCIYPMYDFAHGLSDALEGITHSICTLEFEVHRPLYEWFLNKLQILNQPRQIEFARLNISYTMMSKRKLQLLVEENLVLGWDDPRMPTISGLRRRGFTPASIREFCDRIGVAKVDSIVDIELLNFCIREELNRTAERKMVILNPLKVTITNFPENSIEEIDCVNNPNDPNSANRKVPFSRNLFIERDDFMEDAPKKFFRLSQGREVRLVHAYYIQCEQVIKDENGEIIELLCTYDPATKGGDSPDGRKVKGTIHWVSQDHCIDAEIRLIDHLFNIENPADVPEGGDWRDQLNPNSMKIIYAKAEPSLKSVQPGDAFQFLRNGYFNADPKDFNSTKPVFNRTVGLKDSWAKEVKKG
jgi:glutaminyl-tRNA synthetase